MQKNVRGLIIFDLNKKNWYLQCHIFIRHRTYLEETLYYSMSRPKMYTCMRIHRVYKENWEIAEIKQLSFCVSRMKLNTALRKKFVIFNITAEKNCTYIYTYRLRTYVNRQACKSYIVKWLLTVKHCDDLRQREQQFRILFHGWLDSWEIVRWRWMTVPHDVCTNAREARQYIGSEFSARMNSHFIRSILDNNDLKHVFFRRDVN